jgi:hypothetical protein
MNHTGGWKPVASNQIPSDIKWPYSNNLNIAQSETDYFPP